MPEDITHLYSLEEFFCAERKREVVVPTIQRAYAQGRESEESLRQRFVDALFGALEAASPLELNFVYGAKSGGENAGRMELLDGQQRITTLILLYWYLACAEDRAIPDFIQSFTYETRLSTDAFLKELARNKISPFAQAPSDEIRARQWYSATFDKDASVRGMLRMLDAIHGRYQLSGEKGHLYDRLGQVKFYELNLENFGLTEEIYIKMNGRGLPLTPFESFKADLVRFMRESKVPELVKKVAMPSAAKTLVPYPLYFEHKMDNDWLNIFWRADDKSGREYSARFFRFFYRFCAGKVFLEQEGKTPLKDFNGTTIKSWDFFWRKSRGQQKIYLGFDFYREMLKKRPDYLGQIALVLNWLENEQNRKMLEKELTDPWGCQRKTQFFEDEYPHADAVKFTAFCEYIIASGTHFDDANFRRWMRLVRNAVNDRYLRNIEDYVSLARSLRTLLLDLHGATADLNAALAMRPISGPRWQKEAVKKAQTVHGANPGEDWEDAFIEAENHPFFAGSISALMHNLPKTPQAFRQRANLAGQLFDGKGMTEAAGKNHRLIRALVRQLTTRQALLPTRETIFTECNDNDHHLRTFLVEKENAGKLLCVLGDMPNLDAIGAHLDSLVALAPDPAVDAPDLLAASPKLANAWQRLCVDERIYDYIKECEKPEKDKFMAFMLYYGKYAIRRKGSWYDTIYIGVNRERIFTKALELGYDFHRTEDRTFYEVFGDVPNDGIKFDDEAYRGIWLRKEAAPGVQLNLSVEIDGSVLFSIDATAMRPRGYINTEKVGKKLILLSLDAAAPDGLGALEAADNRICGACKETLIPASTV